MAGGLQARQYFKFSLVTCFLLLGPLAKLVDALMHQNLWKLAISQTFVARTILPVISQVEVFRLLRGSTCWSARRGRRSPFQKKCLERIARNHYSTTRNKPLMISEDCHVKFKTTMFSNRSDALG